MMQEKLSSLDENFWHIDSKNNRQNVSLIFILEESIDIENFKKLITEHLEYFPLKTKKIVEKNSKLIWQSENISADEHFQHIDDSSGKSIEEIASNILSKDIDKTISPWKIITINSNNAKTDKYALMFYWHHSLCDGVGYLEYIESMCSETKDGTPRIKKMLQRKEKYSSRPQKNINIFYHLYESGIKLFNDLFSSQIKSPFNGNNSNIRKVAFLDFELDEVNKKRKHLSASLYEYMLTLTTIATKNFSLKKNLTPRNLRVIIPVNMREKKQTLELSNFISGSSLILPINEEKKSSVIRNIKEQLSSIKVSHAYKILAACNSKLPPNLQRKVAEFAAKKTNFICSTAPGSRHQRFLAGSRIKKIYGTPALMKGQGMSFGYIRYNKTMTITLTYDPNILKDPDTLLEQMQIAHKNILN